MSIAADCTRPGPDRAAWRPRPASRRVRAPLPGQDQECDLREAGDGSARPIRGPPSGRGRGPRRHRGELMSTDRANQADTAPDHEATATAPDHEGAATAQDDQ